MRQDIVYCLHKSEDGTCVCTVCTSRSLKSDIKIHDSNKDLGREVWRFEIEVLRSFKFSLSPQTMVCYRHPWAPC